MTTVVSGDGTITRTGGVDTQGTNTNDNAAAGQIGEYLESTAAFTNAPTSTQWGDLTSMELSAGDWDVTALCSGYLNGATVTANMQVGISTTAGNSSTGLVEGVSSATMRIPTSTENTGGCVPNLRVPLDATTTVYLKVRAYYSAGTPQFAGRISARRIR